MKKLEWIKIPSVLTGGKPFFWNAWPNGKGHSPKLTVVWARVAGVWWAQVDDIALESFQTPAKAKAFLAEKMRA